MGWKKIFAALCVLLILSCFAGAASLTVEKVVPVGRITAGSEVNISLNIMNPFGKDIPIKIVDKNVFANNGLDIQCLEYTLQAGKGVQLGYEPVKAYSAGNFTLGTAEITYTNPDTGQEEKAFSAPVNISVIGVQTGQASGITTIYRCNGMNMQSTSFSSQGQSQSGQSQQQNQKNLQNQEQAQKAAVQNNQMNQNTQALQQEIAKQKETEQAFNNSLESNPDFRKQDEELKQDGFQPQPNESSQSPAGNDSGSFDRKYQKPSGEQASVKGDLNKGQMENMSVDVQDSPDRMMQALSENRQFQNMNTSLGRQGFNQSQAGRQFKSLGDNKTEIKIPFNDSTGRQRNITAQYSNGNVTNVSMDEQPKKENKTDYVPLLEVLIIIALAAYFLLTRKKKKKQVVVEKMPEPVKEVDYLSASLDMLKEAEKLFSEGKEKDAYELVSQAVRYYYSGKLKTGGEMTNMELIDLLNSKGMDYSLVQKCLNLCGMVEFAKYKANKEDFGEIMRSARNIII